MTKVSLENLYSRCFITRGTQVMDHVGKWQSVEEIYYNEKEVEFIDQEGHSTFITFSNLGNFIETVHHETGKSSPFAAFAAGHLLPLAVVFFDKIFNKPGISFPNYALQYPVWFEVTS